MIRLFGGGFIGLLLLGLWVYCVFDVISTDSALARNLPKMAWLMIVVFLPDIGSIAWLALGRPQFAGWRPGDTARAPRRVVGPEDLPTYPASRAGSPDERLQAWEDDLHRREEEHRRRREGGGPAASGDQ